MMPRLAVTAVAALTVLVGFAPAATSQEPIVRTVTFESPSVGRTLKYNIALPERYEQSDTRFPVLYLLHGLTSNYTAWAKLGAARAAQGLDLIVVMADAGNSWYVNWAESEDGQKNAWEDSIIQDLIGHVDAHFRTVPRREGRAINGLSMGGYGGLTLGLRHPDLFCSIGSQSGALNFARSYAQGLKLGGGRVLGAFGGRNRGDTPNPDIGLDDFDSQAERTPKGKLFTSAEQAEAHDPFRLVLEVPKDKLPHIYLDCGTEDRLITSSRDFAKLLIEHNIPFTYGESAGGHVPAYWAREIHTAIAVQYAVLRRNLSQSPVEDTP
jgi:S-formylglutathione hydrolase FrmB